MLLSTSKKFIFFHNYKVAGTSVRKALKCFESMPFYYASRFFQKAGADKNGVFEMFNSHVSSNVAKKYLPKKMFNEYFKFGFVRNPWSWQVSLYFYMLKNKKHYQHDHVASLGTFNAYLRWRVENELRLQKQFFYDSNSDLVVDFIGKHENINNDFKTICLKLGLHDIELPVLNVSSSASWVDQYNLESFNLVKDAYKDDIECFCYQDDPEFYKIK